MSIKKIHSDQLTSLLLYHHQLCPTAHTSLLEGSSSGTGLLEFAYFRINRLQWSWSNVTPLPEVL